MARPTKSEFEKWDPTGLSRRADAVKAVVDGLGHGADDSGAAQKSVGNNFEGRAADAIGEQTIKDVGSLRQVHDAADGVRAAYANGEQKLTPSINGVREALQSAQQNGFTVTDDWQLQDTQRPGMRRSMVQEQLQQHLDGVVTALDQADNEVMTDIAKSEQALMAAPMPQFAPEHAPTPEQPPAQPEPPRPDDHPQDQGQPGAARDVGSEEKPGVTDVNDPGVNWDMNVEEWKKSWKNPLVADNPPGYTGGPGPERDQAWKSYLSTLKPGARGFLPNPDAVADNGLKVVGHAATQLGTSYAWAGGDMKGPGKGVLGSSPDASWTYKDNTRTGFDCSGLTEYAAGKVIGGSIGGYTEPQLDSPKMHDIGPGETPQPGDFVYYGPDAAHRHVGVYVAPGVIINAPESGRPVELDNRGTSSQGSGEHPVRVRRLN